MVLLFACSCDVVLLQRVTVCVCEEMSSNLTATEELVKRLQHENKRMYILLTYLLIVFLLAASDATTHCHVVCGLSSYYIMSCAVRSL